MAQLVVPEAVVPVALVATVQLVPLILVEVEVGADTVVVIN